MGRGEDHGAVRRRTGEPARDVAASRATAFLVARRFVAVATVLGGARWRPRSARPLLAAAALAIAVVPIALSLSPAALAQSPTIPLPPDVALVPPAADVPRGAARFAGVWANGAWDGVLPHVLVVESVDASGQVRVVYALGDYAEGGISRGFRRVTGRMEGDALTLDLGDGARAVYRIDAETLRGTYTRGRRAYTIALTRASLADASRTLAIVAAAVTGTTVRIPLVESGSGGARLTLEATLYRPAGDGPHPVLLFNHGSTGRGAIGATVTLRPSRQAPFFVERGFAVLAPMRRGRGASDGEALELEGACSSPNLGPGFARAIEDVDAAMAYVRAQPWADPARVVIAGQSRGGILSVAYAAERPGAARAVINFAGGWTGDGCDRYGEGFNAPTFTAAGRRVRVPTLWLYAEGDSYYSAASVRRYHEAFAQAGGASTFRLFPDFGRDGHRLVDHVDLWGAAVDQFLRGLQLSTR
jgi:dienelactone hydrolase